MIEQHEGGKEAVAYAKEHLAETTKAGRWMAAYWSIAEDGTIKMRRVTNNFPYADIEAAIKLLQDDLAKECGKIDTSPLPVAPLAGSVGELLGETGGANAARP